MVDSIDSLIRSHHAIIQYGFDQALEVVKVQCTFACDLLVLSYQNKGFHIMSKILSIFTCFGPTLIHMDVQVGATKNLCNPKLITQFTFCHCNIAHLHHINFFFFQIAITTYPFSVTLPLMLQIFKHKKETLLGRIAIVQMFCSYEIKLKANFFFIIMKL